MKLFGNIIDNNDIVNKQYVDSAVSGKQDTLVSGTNIKTINNQSVLGSGNLEIESEEEFLKATYQRQGQFSTLWELKSGETFDPSELNNNRRAVFVVDTIGTPRINNTYYLGAVIEPFDPDSPFDTSGQYRLITDSTTLDVTFYKNGNVYVRNIYQLQNKLVSGTNIKTINNQSLLGAGNIEIEGGNDVFVAEEDVTTYQEAVDALSTCKLFVVKSGSSYMYANAVAGSTGVRYYTLDGENTVILFEIAQDSTWSVTPKYLQSRLVSGTNIKTINNQSVLGSGNIDISDVFIAEYGVTTSTELIAAYNAGKGVFVIASLVDLGFSDSSTIKSIFPAILNVDDPIVLVAIGFTGAFEQNNVETIEANYQCAMVSSNGTWTNTNDHPVVIGASKSYVDTKTALATETTAGTFKLNPAQSILLNANGQLEVGGRLGQFEGTTGIYASSDRAPRNVGNSSFLITDALGMELSTNRAFALVSGLGIACKSAAAGSTEYRISNTYANRIVCKMVENGYASRDEATSKAEQIVPVVSVTINGSAFTPSSAADDSTKDIVIKTSETLNPDTAITNIRLFGKMSSYSTAHIGNGIASWGGGRNMLLGGGVTKEGSSNDNCLIGNGIYCTGNGNAAFGRYHIIRKNRGFFAGTGHDSTNASGEGVSAIGVYSYIDANTMFAVGNGTSHTARLNLFEVTKDSGIVLRSPNGTRYKITISNTGAVTTTAI